MRAVCDVLVMGGGVAGVAAALAAAQAGARTVLVRRGPGTTALATGAWRSAPPDRFAAALDSAGLPLLQCTGRLPHPDGMLQLPERAAPAHAAASIGPATVPMLVCGIAGLPAFRPAALARLWSAAAGLSSALEPILLTLPGTPPAGWSEVSLAAAVERQPQLLGAAIASAARARGTAAAIVPAVLGIDDHLVTWRAVSESAGVAVGEALGMAPSLPGWRLDRALLRMLQHADVETVAGTISGTEVNAGRLLAVSVQGSSAPLRAHSFVLATGKFIGGGISAEAEFTEQAIGCDVVIERFARTISDAGASLVLTDPARSEPQPLLSIGVSADAEGRPLSSAGDVRFTNVFVAGAIRAGIDTAGASLGAMAHDGWSAGERAAALSAA